MNYSNYSGVILAGGQNSRYHGIDKAFIEVNGQKIIDRTLNCFKPLFKEIIIVSNRPESYTEYDNHCIITSDHYKEIGPLGGIHSAMKVATNHFLFIVSCDMPWIQSELVKHLLDYHKTIGPFNLISMPDGKTEPLHAIYDRNTLPALERHIKETGKRSIRSFLDQVDTQFYESPILLNYVKSFININSPEDFSKYSHSI